VSPGWKRLGLSVQGFTHPGYGRSCHKAAGLAMSGQERFDFRRSSWFEPHSCSRYPGASPARAATRHRKAAATRCHRSMAALHLASAHELSIRRVNERATGLVRQHSTLRGPRGRDGVEITAVSIGGRGENGETNLPCRGRFAWSGPKRPIGCNPDTNRSFWIHPTLISSRGYGIHPIYTRLRDT